MLGSLKGPALGPRGRTGRGLYENLDPFTVKGWREVREWRRGRKAQGWRPTGAPAPVTVPDLARIRAPPGPQVTWVGHATTLIQMNGMNVLTDPVWGNVAYGTVKREAPPGIAFKELPRIDLVVVSHNHYDHLDAPTIRKLPRATPIVCPSGLRSWFRWRGFRNVTALAWWERARFGSVDVTSVPAQHWSRRGLFDTAKTHWCGCVLEGERRVYFAGDTGYFSGFRLIRERVGAPDLALLPAGAYEPRWFMREVHMNPEDAVQAFKEVGARQCLPIHWGTFRLTDEPLDEPPERLRAAWSKEGLPPDRLTIPRIGETVGIHA